MGVYTKVHMLQSNCLGETQGCCTHRVVVVVVVVEVVAEEGE
jgi:hypothetical protein